ncbi:hypothetical protein [Paracandidimonas lactea]|uniref:hypothetical protein n=1 Tax=Paracandidimonas lactea TaxID=2895524 RepID=UPI001F3EE55A|nr:hypothetical protein [Paracandidimonas lactea]
MPIRDIGLKDLNQAERVEYRAKVRELSCLAVQKLREDYGLMAARDPQKTETHAVIRLILELTGRTRGSRSDEALLIDFLRGRMDRGTPAAPRAPRPFRPLQISADMRMNAARAAATQPTMYTPNGVGIANQYSEFFVLKKEQA